MDIGIIGGGSLGLLLSANLARHHNITLYVKRIEQRDHIQRNGIILNNGNDKQVYQINTSLIDCLGDHDLYFVAVKQPQLESVLSYLHKISARKAIVFLQNGMGHIEKISRLPQPIYVGTVEHGAHRTDDNEVNHLGMGTVKIASFSKSATNLTNLQSKLHDSLFPFEMNSDWEQLLKSKLLINAVINPLTALFNVPNGSIITNEHIKRLAKKLSDETATVLRFEKEQSWQHVKRVAKNTKDNTSSMRADILQDRETEIEAISGYILKQANEDKTPHTFFVYTAILALQERGNVK